MTADINQMLRDITWYQLNLQPTITREGTINSLTGDVAGRKMMEANRKM